MLVEFWHIYLYQPTFNALIFIYNEWTNANLGWAIVYMTILLRLFLLPFTLINEKNRIRNQALLKDVQQLDEQFQHDPVMRKEEIRRVLKKRRARPWSRAIVLGIQLLFVILLYEVFIGGISGEKLINNLYPVVNYPGVINTMFFGFDLGGTHTFVWPGFVALLLFFEIYMEYRKRGSLASRADLVYFLFFPAVIFFVLWLLPMVKSLFALTSMVFSLIIHQFSKLIFRPAQKKEEAKASS